MEIKDGEEVLIYFSHSAQQKLKIRKDEITITQHGKLIHNDIINNKFGTQLQSTKKSFFVLPITLFSRIELDLRRTQIIFEMDTSLIIGYFNLRHNYKVIECGTGTGILTLVFSDFLSEEGKIFSYEIDEERFLFAKEKFKERMNIEMFNCNVNLNGFIQNEVDCVFLDMGDPINTIEHAYKSLRLNGVLCVFLPSFQQILNAIKKLETLFVNIRMFECFKGDYCKSGKTKNVYLINDQYLHTGYLIFANK